MPAEAMICVEFRQPRLRGSKFSPSPARSVGEGARRTDEGSLFKLNRYVRFILLQKSSSPACRQTGRALTWPSATLVSGNCRRILFKDRRSEGLGGRQAPRSAMSPVHPPATTV